MLTLVGALVLFIASPILAPMTDACPTLEKESAQTKKLTLTSCFMLSSPEMKNPLEPEASAGFKT